MTRWILLLGTVAFLALFAGCPDYSHLRDQPDYDNMTDGGEVFEEE